RLNKRRLARLAADILLLDRRMAQIVVSNANLTRRYELLTSMQGVGPTLAFTLVALLPELGQMSRKQIAALVGLAPYVPMSALGQKRTSQHIQAMSALPPRANVRIARIRST